MLEFKCFSLLFDSAIQSCAEVPTSPCSEPSSVSCVFFNSHYIVNKCQDFFTINKLNNIAICETFHDSSILHSEVFLPGYMVYHLDHNCHGGGLLVADSIPSVCRHDLEMPDIELIWIQIYRRLTALFFVSSVV